MSSLIASSPTYTRAFQGHDAADHADPGRVPSPSRSWALLEAFSHASALIDPTGVLASHRFRRPKEEQRHGRRSPLHRSRS